MEYTSRDAHIGCASRRGDLEVLFYNLIEWFGGSLPWDRECASPQVTKTAKFLAFRQMGKFLRICFRGEKYPAFLVKFMKYINGLQFEEEPDYDFLRGLVYEEMRDSIWAKRSQNSLENPTQAMLDIMEKMENPPIKTPSKGRKRTKSFCEEKTSNTPAMMEVMKLKKMKSMDDANSNLAEDHSIAALLPMPFLKLSPVVPASVISPKKRSKKNLRILKKRLRGPQALQRKKKYHAKLS